MGTLNVLIAKIVDYDRKLQVGVPKGGPILRFLPPGSKHSDILKIREIVLLEALILALSLDLRGVEFGIAVHS